MAVDLSMQRLKAKLQPGADGKVRVLMHYETTAPRVVGGAVTYY